MLSYHCPECNVPLFQEEETIFCPSCQKEAVLEQEGEKRVTSESTKANVISSEGEMREKDEDLSQEQGTKRKIIKGSSGISDSDEVMDVNKDVSEMEASLKNTLIKLSKELENTKDVKEIKEIVDVMDKITSMAERIKRL